MNSRIAMERKLLRDLRSIPRYEFSKENKKYLQQFMQVSAENKSNQFCNLKMYECFKKILPMGEDLRKELEYPYEVIDITVSDDEEKNELVLNLEPQNEEIKPTNLNQTTVDDIVFSIKETLETEKNIPIAVFDNLQASNINVDDIFSVLSMQLNHEEVINLGLSIKEVTLTNELIVSYYIRYLLIKEMSNEYSNEIQNVINDFAAKYEAIVKEEISQWLLNQENAPNKVTLQFLDGTEADFKSKLLKQFVFSCNMLRDVHIGTIDILLSNQVDYDCLNKLVNLMSTSAIMLSSDKSYGKLIMNVLKLLGRNVHLLEQSLKHIINSHRSIWKAKILQMLQEALQESFSITQSFRY